MGENIIKSSRITSKWIFLLRQLLVSSAIWSTFFIQGLNLGSATVLVPQLRKEANSTDAVSPEQASWLAAVIGYAAIPWIVFLPMIADFYGRKIAVGIVCISTLIGYIIFYCSSDVEQIIISELFQAAMAACTFIAVCVITEYTSTELRGLFLTIKSASLYWGVLAANTIGTFNHWKNIPLFGFICASYCLIALYFWPESPFWLVKQGRFDQCAESHRWLKGSSENSEKELYKLLVDNQNTKKKLLLKRQILDMMKTVVKREFYKPSLLFIALVLLHMFSGKLVCVVYAIEILKKITNNTSTAYTGMLILDTVTALCMYVGCAFSKTCKRRSLLFICSATAIVFLFLLSLYLYLVKLNIIFEDSYVSLSLLIGYSISIGCGPLILSTSIAGELIPVESRSLSLCIIGLISQTGYGTFMKIAPNIFICFGMHGTFLFFGISSTIVFLILYYYLPETKDKTLQEIQDILNGTKPVEESRELLPKTSNMGNIVSKTGRKLEEVS